MPTSIITTAKGKIAYRLHGQGKPILFIHGGHTSCKETIFHKGLDPDKYCSIIPSRPGYGNTPLTDANKTPKGTADLLIALLDALQLQKVVVAGISAGGLVALEIAAGYPDRVESLVLMSALTKKWFAPTDKLYTGGKKAFAPAVEPFTWWLYRLFFRLFPKAMTRVMFKSLSNYRPVEFTANELQEVKQMTFNMRSGKGFVNDLDQTIDPEILTGITCPTLILHSHYDKAVDISHPLHAKDKIKHARLLTFNNRWGHLIWIGKEYDQYLHAFKEFIAGNPNP